MTATVAWLLPATKGWAAFILRLALSVAAAEDEAREFDDGKDVLNFN